jgi:heptose-I-phosphate ethanolaminephosphotransferase
MNMLLLGVPWIRLAIAAAYVTLAPALMLMKWDGVYFTRMIAVSGFNAILTALICAAVVTLRNDLARKTSYTLLGTSFVIYALVVFYYVLVYDEMIGVAAASAVIDSNPTGYREYLSAFLDPASSMRAIALALPIAVAVTIGPKKMTLENSLARTILVVAAIGLAAAGYTKEFIRKNSLYFVVTTSFAEVVASKKEVVETVKRFGDRKPLGVVNHDARRRVHVLVLGETATRRHMSLYGYDRPTNPLLEAIRDKLLVVADACSSRGATAPALQELMSFANREDATPLFTQPSFLETLKAAGYRTYWLSNQPNAGLLATWATIFAAAADVRTLVNANGGTDEASRMDTRSYDEKLLAPFDAALSEPGDAKFILVHLMGSHAAYELRYPPSYAVFGADGPGAPPEKPGSFLDFWRKKSADVDAYDNSMLYNDFVLHRLIERASAGDVDTLTYLSDHGEGLGENGGARDHHDGSTVRQVYEIPLFFHVGARFSVDRPETVDRMKAALDRPFQSDRLTHTLLDLYAIEAPQRRQEWSLFSADYRPPPRFCDSLAKVPDVASIRGP